MITETPLGWVALAAFLVGAVVRLLKTDGMKIALAYLGLPPIPSRALPWLALVLGGVAAVLDARVAGASWDAAAQAGVLAAALAVFGHELGSGVPGLRKILSVGLLVGAGSLLPGCAFLQKNPELVEDFARKSACALARMNLPNDQIIRECDLKPEDLLKILPLLGTAREEAAREALGARIEESLKRCDADGGAPGDAGASDAAGD